LATVLTAVVAYWLYRKAQRDEIENAAKIIVLEIKSSEKVIKDLLETKNMNLPYSSDLVKLTPYKGWIRYSHLFVRQLNGDEFEQLNSYFKNCETLEKYIEKNHNFFWITTEERARQHEIMGATLARENPTWDALIFADNIERMLETYRANTSAFTPQGIKTQMDRYLNSTPLVTTTPVWNKLKRMAKYED
jgi:hypothetical protein